MIGLCLLLILGAAEDPELALARASLSAGRYFEVLPHLEKARTHALTVPERVQAYELEGVTQAAFGRPRESKDAFRNAIGLDSHYHGPKNVSPKVDALFMAARKEGPPPRKNVVPADAPLAVPPAPSIAWVMPRPLEHEVLAPRPLPLVQRWWFWTAVGVVVAGGATGTALALQRHLPPSTLGNQELP